MFRLLQRMDDSAPRHAEGGGRAALRLLKPVTVLAGADETPLEAVETWARGLDWVHWLFSSIRNRMETLYLEGDWEVSEQRASELGLHLISAWRAAEAGDAEALQELDRALGGQWPESVNERSLKAGDLLLRSTRGARYQGVLGRFRKACEAGATPGHFVTVWAAAGEFFQLSVANVVAEYLHLEAAMAARGAGTGPSIPVVEFTSRLLRESGHGLRFLGETETESGGAVAATPS